MHTCTIFKELSAEEIIMTDCTKRTECEIAYNSDQPYAKYKGKQIFKKDNGELYYESGGKYYYCWEHDGLFEDVKWERLKKIER